MLICKFASERSAPTRIQNYVSYLRQVEAKCGSDPQVRQLVEALRQEAQSWMTGRRPD